MSDALKQLIILKFMLEHLAQYSPIGKKSKIHVLLRVVYMYNYKNWHSIYVTKEKILGYIPSRLFNWSQPAPAISYNKSHEKRYQALPPLFDFSGGEPADKPTPPQPPVPSTPPSTQPPVPSTPRPLNPPVPSNPPSPQPPVPSTPRPLNPPVPSTPPSPQPPVPSSPLTAMLSQSSYLSGGPVRGTFKLLPAVW